MILEHLNYLAVAVCTVIYFVIGGTWFSPILFSKPWMDGHKIVMPTDDIAKAEMRKKMPTQMLTTFIVCFIMTVAMACLVSIFNSHSAIVGIKIGLLASVFGGGTILLSHMFTGKSMKTMMIDAGYHIVGLIVVGIILSVWR
jgi:hypothetical protein